MWSAIDKKEVPVVWVRIELTKAYEQRYVELGAWADKPTAQGQHKDVLTREHILTSHKHAVSPESLQIYYM